MLCEELVAQCNCFIASLRYALFTQIHKNRRLIQIFRKKVDTGLIIVFLRVACGSQNNDIYFCVKGIAYLLLLCINRFFIFNESSQIEK